jgi:hypothetical protein
MYYSYAVSHSHEKAMMTIKGRTAMDLNELQKARRQCIEELAGLPGWVLGSLVETEREQSGRRKPFRYLSRSVNGRNRTTYVSEAQMPQVRQALEGGRAARQLLGRVSDLTMMIIKASDASQEGQR